MKIRNYKDYKPRRRTCDVIPFLSMNEANLTLLKLTVTSVIFFIVLHYNRNVKPYCLSVLSQNTHIRATDLVTYIVRDERCSSLSDFHIKLNVTLLFYDKLRLS